LPANAQIFALSREGEIKKKAKELANLVEEDRPCVFVVGAFAHGRLEIEYTDKTVSISDLPLSAACCISKLTNAVEDKWDIA